MQLVEALVASTVFAVSAGGALQLSAASAASSLSSRDNEQTLERVEQDRLQLQGIWQRALAQPGDCAQALLAMEAGAASLQPPAGVQRQLRRSADGALLEISWQAPTAAAPLRRRWISPVALGLCVPQSSAQPSGAGGIG